MPSTPGRPVLSTARAPAKIHRTHALRSFSLSQPPERTGFGVSVQMM